MKLLLVIFTLKFLVNLTLGEVTQLHEIDVNELDDFSAIQLFEKINGKPPPEQRALRRRNVQKCIDEIRAHKKKYELGMVTHEIGLNKYSDWTATELQSLMSTKVTGRASTGGRSPPTNVTPVPNVTLHTMCNVPVEDQKQCGSCYAFSATHCCAIAECIQCQNPNPVTYSEQELVDCSSAYGNQGCNGGLMTNCYKYIIAKGITGNNDYPYTAVTGTCNRSSIATINNDLISYNELPANNEPLMRQTMAQFTPMAVAIDASNLAPYTNGIISSCPTRCTLNHGVVLVGMGYNSTSNLNYWIVKNSWGANWGLKGYFNLVMDQNCLCVSEVVSTVQHICS